VTRQGVANLHTIAVPAIFPRGCPGTTALGAGTLGLVEIVQLLVSLFAGVLTVGLVVMIAVVAADRPKRCLLCKARAVKTWWAGRAAPKPMPSYHRCERCGARLRRLVDGPWEDASALEFDRFYRNAPPLPLPDAGTYRVALTAPSAPRARAGRSSPPR
jgi:hypothetical protein